jgi:Tfp pilus assembly protein PilN
MRAVNLIPPEDRRGDRAPLRTGPLAYAVVGALLFAFIGVYLLVSTGNTISENKAAVAGLEGDLASSQARAEALQSFTSFASLEEQRTATVDSLARSRFDWQRVMRELAFVIPSDVSLTALNGGVGASAADGAGGGGTSSAAAGINSPTLTMNGCAGNGHITVARMVAALRDIDGVTRVGLSSSNKPGATDETGGVPAAPSAQTEEEGGGCVKPRATTFEITVAFDEVQVDAEGAITPAAPADPASPTSDEAAEVKEERRQTEEGVASAQERSRDAIGDYVPGA